MPATAQLGILIALAYIVGSIPFGLVVALAKGVDPRLSGSGNIGATNAARAIGGKRWFFLIFFLDMLKGLLPMLVAAVLLRHESRTAETYLLWLAVGLAAVLGHMFSIFLKFKGGKGVATSAGIMLGLYPYYTYPGLIGAILSPLMTGIQAEENNSLPYASSLCGACYDACPVKINIPDILVHLRSVDVDSKRGKKKLPTQMDVGMNAASWALSDRKR